MLASVLQFPTNVSRRNLNESRKFEYSLEIRNLKEEAKDENYESGISDNDEDSEKSKKD